MRAMAREIYQAHRDSWSIDDAVAFADRLITDRHLETKAVGIEVLARYRRQFVPALLRTWKRWLARGHSSNWATTDAVSSLLIGPLLLQHPGLREQLPAWSRHPSSWVRRAAAVGLIPSVRRGFGLDLAYRIAQQLHPDREDLIQKAVGWMLREAGKVDERRLEEYLLAHGSRIPRTTVRYAIERFPATRRRLLLARTRAPVASPRKADHGC
jgi:3-methyladenine DNA glycosylase AlkD